VRLMRTLARMFDLVSASNWITRQLVYRTVAPSAVQDPWERSIIELADGRSIGEITEILYREEIRSGAWALDIGLWRHLFDHCVVNTIRKLESQGYICVMPGTISYGRVKWLRPETAEAKP